MQRSNPIKPDSDVYQQIQTGIEKLFKKVDLNPFESHEGFVAEDFKTLEATISQKLVIVFNKLAHLLPKKEKLNILSLGCGFAEEFLALKYVYSDTPLNYVGIDIKEEQNEKVQAAYRDFPELTLLTCNGADQTALMAALREKACLPSRGFDLVVLRQPNIASLEYGISFMWMLQNIIPFFSAVDGKTFISCYNEIEFGLVRQNLPDKFFSFSRGNAVRDGSENGVAFSDGFCLQPDKFSSIVSCHGLALKNAHKLLMGGHSLHGLHAVRSVLNEEILAQVKQCGSHASIIAAVKENQYGTALRKACVMGDTKLVKILMAAQPRLKFNINEPADNNKWTALDFAQNINPEQKSELIELLLANGAKTSKELLAMKLA